MDWHETIFELIDMRSFSNLWFWIALAVMWSTASHWVLGVPYDLVLRARRKGGQAEVDLEDMVRVNVNRLLDVARISGLWVLGFVCFALTGLAISGFYYEIEIAQALFLLGFPMTFVGAMSIATAHRIERKIYKGEDLRRCLGQHRFFTQVIGMISIFVTALWGMYQNMSLGPFGG